MEREILQVLREAHGAHLSAKEVGKMADRQQYREDASWARGVLQLLAGRGVIEQDPDGRYYCPTGESAAT